MHMKQGVVKCLLKADAPNDNKIKFGQISQVIHFYSALYTPIDLEGFESTMSDR